MVEYEEKVNKVEKEIQIKEKYEVRPIKETQVSIRKDETAGTIGWVDNVRSKGNTRNEKTLKEKYIDI